MEIISHFDIKQKFDRLRDRISKIPAKRTRVDNFFRKFIAPKNKATSKSILFSTRSIKIRSKYRNYIRKKYKLYYFVANIFNRIVKIKDYIHSSYSYYIKYRFHVVKLDVPKNYIVDTDERIVYATFQCLMDFIHKEHMPILGSDKKYNSVEDFLLEQVNESEPNTNEYLKHKTLYDLYMWWVHYRKHQYMMITTNERNEFEASDFMARHDIDDAMLNRLLAIRGWLWY